MLETLHVMPSQDMTYISVFFWVILSTIESEILDKISPLHAVHNETHAGRADQLRRTAENL